MAKVVVVKFRNSCKPYYFSAENMTLEEGQGVIVDTAHGQEYAIVIDPEREVEELVAPLKPVLRLATEKDVECMERNDTRRDEAMRICKEKIIARGLEMKLISCEFAFDGSKVVFYFSAEGRVDFRELVRDLAAVFHMRIELRQVGIRDETRILGGIAACGRECCCASCMPDFKKVSIKMAKNQGLSLNPGKISGLCGRLMCCLAYENDYYAVAYKKMPKFGSTIGTPDGQGTVVSTNMLKMEVRVKIEKDGGLFYRDFPVDVLEFRRGTDVKEDESEAEEELAEILSEEPEVKSEQTAEQGNKQENKREKQKAQEKQPMRKPEKQNKPSKNNKEKHVKPSAENQQQEGAERTERTEGRVKRKKFKNGKHGAKTSNSQKPTEKI